MIAKLASMLFTVRERVIQVSWESNDFALFRSSNIWHRFIDTLVHTLDSGDSFGCYLCVVRENDM